MRNGQVRESHFSVRVPTIPELRGWLADAGFTDATFTARNGKPPSIHHPRLIVVRDGLTLATIVHRLGRWGVTMHDGSHYSMRRPQIARPITSCWICSVPSKMS